MVWEFDSNANHSEDSLLTREKGSARDGLDHKKITKLHLKNRPQMTHHTAANDANPLGTQRSLSETNIDFSSPGGDRFQSIIGFSISSVCYFRQKTDCYDPSGASQLGYN